MCPLCSSIFPIFSDQHSDSWNQDTKVCLHAAGGIYVNENFEHSGGKIEVSNSSAEQNGGAVLKDEDEEDETSADGGTLISQEPVTRSFVFQIFRLDEK